MPLTPNPFPDFAWRGGYWTRGQLSHMSRWGSGSMSDRFNRAFRRGESGRGGRCSTGM